MLSRAARPFAQTAKNVPRRFVRPLSSVSSQRRTFYTAPTKVAETGTYVTKYKLTVAAKDGHDFDDFQIALPDKDQLGTSVKDTKGFLRFLNLALTKEGRKEDYEAFLKRCKDGLEVESDVYISTEELLANMWTNGFGECERNAIQLTFPPDYKFHYPELAVMFDLTEEQCYKYCMRTRMEASHIGAIKVDNTNWGWVRDHWVAFGMGCALFKFFPFYNYYFVLKSFGTGMWIYTVWNAAKGSINKSVAAAEFQKQQHVAKEIMDGEDKIIAAMKRFANDSSALDGVKSFEADVEKAMTHYRASLIDVEMQQVAFKAEKQLSAISSFEDSIASKLQESIVKEVKADFVSKMTGDAAMQDAAFSAALKGINGNADPEDPLTKHFGQAMGSIDLSGSAKQDKNGNISERLSALSADQEAEFVKTFYISGEDVAEVKAAKGDDIKMEQIMQRLYAKVGFHAPQLPATQNLSMVEDSGLGDAYTTAVNNARNKLHDEIRRTRLAQFESQFA